MKEILYEKRKYIIAGALALVVLLAVVLVCAVRGHAKNTRYENYMDTAEEYLLLENMDSAITYYERAYEVKDTDECAIALARAYAQIGATREAEDILLNQIDHTKGKRAEALKQALQDLRAGADEPKDDGILIAGESYGPETTAIIIQNTRLTSEDLDAIAGFTELSTLSLKNCGLTDLDFLKNLDELMSLTLSDNDIKDLSDLAALRDLKTLYLDNNPIEDFSPLYRLTELSTLSIKGIDITQTQYDELKEALDRCSIFNDDTVAEELTVGGVKFLSDVQELDLSGKDITDLSELAKCTQLTRLNLKNNKVSDLSPLEGLSSLTWLCLCDNDVQDVSPLGQLVGLTYLDLGDNEITNINTLSSLTKLTELYLDDNEIGNFNALSYMTSLKKLGLKDTNLTDKGLEALKLESLTTLDISENKQLTASAVKALKAAIPKCDVIHDQLAVTLGSKEFDATAATVDASNAGVTDLTNLSQLTAVTALMLNNNAISDFTPIAKLQSLTVLELWNTGVSDITFLAGMNKLTNLNLAQNKLRDVYALSSCTGLKELILTDNPDLTDAAPLAYCTNLSVLYLDGTGVTDLSALSGLTKLTSLHLDGCQLTDATQLYSLTGLKELYVMNCGLSADAVTALKQALPNCAVYA